MGLSCHCFPEPRDTTAPAGRTASADLGGCNEGGKDDAQKPSSPACSQHGAALRPHSPFSKQDTSLLQENCLWGTVPSCLPAADPRGALSAASALALALGIRLGHKASRPREGVWFDSRTKQREVFMARRQEHSGFIMKRGSC